MKLMRSVDDLYSKNDSFVSSYYRLSSIIIVWYLGKENQSRPIIKGLPAPDVHYITI